MFNQQKNLDELEKVVKSLLSQDRCSFSDEEKVLLEKCLNYLQQAKEINVETGFLNTEIISKAIEILLKLFLIADHVQKLL